jgi:hypothetical protein
MVIRGQNKSGAASGQNKGLLLPRDEWLQAGVSGLVSWQYKKASDE